MAHEALLGSTDFFSGADPEVLAAIAASGTERALIRGDVLFREGDTADCLYVVTRGRLAIVMVNEFDRRETVVSLMEPGDLFGEMAMLDDGPRSAMARALEPSDVLCVPYTAVLEAFRDQPAEGADDESGGESRAEQERRGSQHALAMKAQLDEWTGIVGGDGAGLKKGNALGFAGPGLAGVGIQNRAAGQGRLLGRVAQDESVAGEGERGVIQPELGGAPLAGSEFVAREELDPGGDVHAAQMQVDPGAVSEGFRGRQTGSDQSGRALDLDVQRLHRGTGGFGGDDGAPAKTRS